jgi:hypothetical protein
MPCAPKVWCNYNFHFVIAKKRVGGGKFCYFNSAARAAGLLITISMSN